MSNVSSIDTDAAIANILSNFSSDYINHIVSNSLNMKFRPFQDEMPNMVDILERQFQGIYDNAGDYHDEVKTVRIETYKEIINIICKYYDLEFSTNIYDMDPLKLYGFTRTLYEIFISKFTEYLFNFFVSFIVDNSDSIYNDLLNDPESKKVKEITAYNSNDYIDPKYLLIHANINTILFNMTSYDIPFSVLLSYFVDPQTASYINTFLTSKNDIYKYHYAKYITDPNTTASVLTSIKLLLQSKTQEINRI